MRGADSYNVEPSVLLPCCGGNMEQYGQLSGVVKKMVFYYGRNLRK